MATDDRWDPYPRWTVAEGIGSTLSLPLQVGSVTRGALNLYAPTAHAFTIVDQQAGQRWAAHAGSTSVSPCVCVSRRIGSATWSRRWSAAS